MGKFVDIVGEALSAFFEERGFLLEDAPLFNDGYVEAAIYRSSDFKLMFYQAPREGEVNCLVGFPESPNRYWPRDGWFYVRALIHHEERTLEELVASRKGKRWLGYEEQLEEIAGILSSRFDEIATNLRDARRGDLAGSPPA